MEKPVKHIFFILDNHWEQCQGGAELQAHFLERAALARGWKVSYFFISTGPFRPPHNTTRFLPVQRKQIWTRLDDIKYPYAPALLSALKAAAPDVIYQRCAMSLTGIAAWYAQKAGIPLLFHIASDRDVRPQTWPLTRPFLMPERRLTRYGIKSATCIIAQTRNQARALKRLYGRDAVVIPNGHPVPPGADKPEEPLTVLWVANWKGVKQPEVFIELARQLKPGPGLRMVMVGKVGEYTTLAQRARDTGIEVTGELPHDQVNALFETSHLLVNTSRHEGFSNTFIQAWLRQIPVISLNADPDHVIETMGLGHCPRSFSGLVHHVRNLMGDVSQRTVIGLRARQYATTHFSIRNMDRILNLMSHDD